MTKKNKSIVWFRQDLRLEDNPALFEAAKNGDIPKLQDLRTRLLPVVETLFSQTNPLPCKEIMEKQGLLRNEARLPLQATNTVEKSDWSFLQ